MARLGRTYIPRPQLSGPNPRGWRLPVRLAESTGNEYYVNNLTGSNSNNATQAQSPSTPWATITYAISQIPNLTSVAGGITIWVENTGTAYNEAVEWSPSSTKVGDATHVLTIRGRNGKPVISYASGSQCFQIFDNNGSFRGRYLRLRDLKFTGINGSNGQAVNVTGNAAAQTWIEFDGLEIYNLIPVTTTGTVNGITVGPNASYVQVRNCKVYDIDPSDVGVASGSRGFFLQGDHVWAINCISYNVNGSGYEWYNSSTAHTGGGASNCVAYSNNGNGFLVSSTYNDLHLRNCISKNNGNRGIYGFYAGGTTGDQSANHCINHGNTVAAAAKDASSRLTFSNNLTGDPLFINAAAGDFHLGVGSPAMNAADSFYHPATDYEGALRSYFDIGAFAQATIITVPQVSATANTATVNIVITGDRLVSVPQATITTNTTSVAVYGNGGSLPARIAESTGTIYYVDGELGTNSGAGTSPGASAWQTISYALANIPTPAGISGGARIYVNGTSSGGTQQTYNEYIDFNNFNGDADSVVTVQGTGNHRPRITHVGANVSLVNFGRGAGNTASYIRLRNFDLDAPSADLGTPSVVVLQNTSSYIELDNVLIHNARPITNTNSWRGIFVNGSSHHVQVWNSQIYDIDPNTAGLAQSCHGMGVQGDYVYVINSIIDHNPNGHGIEIFGGGTSQTDYGIFHCVLAYNGRTGVLVTDRASNFAMRNCIVYNNGTLSGGSQMGVYGYPQTGTDGTNQTVQNCVIYGNPGGAFNLGPVMTESGNNTTDPTFINAASRNFSLTAGSPAIGFGAGAYTPATDMVGNGWHLSSAGALSTVPVVISVNQGTAIAPVSQVALPGSPITITVPHILAAANSVSVLIGARTNGVNLPARIAESTGAIYYVDKEHGSNSYSPTQAQSASTPWQTIQYAIDNIPNPTTVGGGPKIMVRGATDGMAPTGSALPARLPQSSGARVFYVDAATGSDSNAGTSEGAAWATLQDYFNGTAGPSNNIVPTAGDIVYVKNYPGQTSSGENGSVGYSATAGPDSAGHCITGRSGSSGNPITVKAYPGHRPVIRGASAAPGTGHSRALTLNTNSAYWRFEGLDLYYSAGNAANESVVYGASGSHHVEFKNCKIHGGTDGSGTFIHHSCSYYHFYNNEVYECDDWRDPPNQSHGIYSQADNTVVVNNVIHDFAEGFGIQFRADDGETMSDSIAACNTIARCNGQSGIVVEDTCSNAQIWNNISVENTRGIRGYDTGATGRSGNVARNNICYNNVTAAFTNDNTNTDKIDWSGTGNFSTTGSGGDNLTSNPLLTNSAGLNFAVQSGSPAIGYGNPAYMPPDDYAGNTRLHRTIGALDYTGVVAQLTYNETLSFNRTGDASHVTTIEGYGTYKPKVKHQSGASSSLTVTSAGDYFRLRNFDLEGRTQDISGGPVIVYCNGNSYAEFDKVDVHDAEAVTNNSTFRWTGWYLSGDHIQLWNCKGYNICPNGVGTASQCHGAYVPGTDIYLINSAFYNNRKGYGAQIYPSPSNIGVYNSVFFRNQKSGCLVDLRTVNCTIKNSIATDNDEYGFEGYTEGGTPGSGQTVQYCIADDNTAGNYNNASGLLASSNNSFGVDPLFVNEIVPPDLHLQSSSPAIGFGDSTYIPATDMDGVAFVTNDIGPFAFASSISSIPVNPAAATGGATTVALQITSTIPVPQAAASATTVIAGTSVTVPVSQATTTTETTSVLPIITIVSTQATVTATTSTVVAVKEVAVSQAIATANTGTETTTVAVVISQATAAANTATVNTNTSSNNTQAVSQATATTNLATVSVVTSSNNTQSVSQGIAAANSTTVTITTTGLSVSQVVAVANSATVGIVITQGASQAIAVTSIPTIAPTTAISAPQAAAVANTTTATVSTITILTVAQAHAISQTSVVNVQNANNNTITVPQITATASSSLITPIHVLSSSVATAAVSGTTVTPVVIVASPAPISTANSVFVGVGSSTTVAVDQATMGVPPVTIIPKISVLEGALTPIATLSEVLLNVNTVSGEIVTSVPQATAVVGAQMTGITTVLPVAQAVESTSSGDMKIRITGIKKKGRVVGRNSRRGF